MLLAAGWLAAGAKRRRHSTVERWRAFTLRRCHLLFGGLLGFKLLRLGLAALRGLLFHSHERRERAQLRQQMMQASTYRWALGLGKVGAAVEGVFSCTRKIV